VEFVWVFFWASPKTEGQPEPTQLKGIAPARTVDRVDSSGGETRVEPELTRLSICALPSGIHNNNVGE
jgi:hypothetical protein